MQPFRIDEADVAGDTSGPRLAELKTVSLDADASVNTRGTDGANGAGEMAFASPDEWLEKTSALKAAGFVVVHVPPLPSVLQGHLAEHVDERIERELAARGAPSPGMAVWNATADDTNALDVRIADQLFRARNVGARGIAVVLGSLAQGTASVLDPDDSATLRRLAQIAADAPVVVLLQESDATLGSFGPPVALRKMLGESRKIVAAPKKERLERQTVGEPHRVDPKHAATVGIVAAGPSDFWRTWALSLGAARGPQSLATLERLFAESYVPLANAIAAGLDDPRACRAYDEFRRGFERTYTDAFATFGATGRRPRLVMDAYDLAAKQARMHDARSTQVVLVDSLRYDLGCLVRDTLASRAGGLATLVNEGILWSALPTTTYRQLETLARGMDALRDPSLEEDDESLRGRVAESVRRMRVGSRELHKLDVIAAMFDGMRDGSPDRGAIARPHAGHVVTAFDDMAEAAAGAIAKHFMTLPPRTLVLVLGDHGFCVDRRGNVTNGGASPEEVLVPALAYVVNDVH